MLSFGLSGSNNVTLRYGKPGYGGVALGPGDLDERYGASADLYVWHERQEGHRLANMAVLCYAADGETTDTARAVSMGPALRRMAEHETARLLIPIEDGEQQAWAEMVGFAERVSGEVDSASVLTYEAPVGLVRAMLQHTVERGFRPYIWA